MTVMLTIVVGMPPRPVVAVDATLLAAGRTGAARVLKNLLAVLPRVDSATDYVALVPRQAAETIAFTGVETRPVSWRSGFEWELRGMQRAAAEAGASAVFTIRELIGPAHVPVVVHVFEPPAYRLRAPRGPGLAGAKSRLKDRLLAAGLCGSLRRAAAVTAGSRTTADWLREHCGAEATVVLPGIDPVFLAPGPRLPAAKPFFLMLASGDARENVELALEAFALASPDGVGLTTVGSPDPVRAQIAAAATRLGIEAAVDARGWVTDEELRDLYASALALIQTSRYESYAGFAALEAMAAGTPVVALAAPGATEALAGAAFLVEREDVHELARAITTAASDETTREGVAAAGRERVGGLTWQSAAETLAGVLRRVQ
jgi:glycosyltransferase involved in cell wall biosynthesis